jgi:hypothetical protein
VPCWSALDRYVYISRWRWSYDRSKQWIIWIK